MSRENPNSSMWRYQRQKERPRRGYFKSLRQHMKFPTNTSNTQGYSRPL